MRMHHEFTGGIRKLKMFFFHLRFLEEFHFHLQEGFSSPPLFSFQIDLILSLTSMGCISNSICAAVLPSSFSWTIKRSASSPQMQRVGDFYREPQQWDPPSHKLPIQFPTLQGILYGSGMGSLCEWDPPTIRGSLEFP